ncbi:MAG: hypothetical protein J7J87_02930 [Candidatus Diapherotrites archaeon]|nr:hypothetical protein [Candidatus Diapherotrites archaeon]
MIIKRIVKALLKVGGRIKQWAEEEEKPLYSEKEEHEVEREVHSLWDFLSFTKNTQAYHLINVIGFDEWVDMQEIRRRIKELFGIEYKNERSLYPYLKTLVDINLIETTNIGGRRKWRKKELLFEIVKEKKSREKPEKEKQKEKIKLKIKKEME